MKRVYYLELFIFAITLVQMINAQTIIIDGKTDGLRFDGIGAVSGGGATSVLLKDYPLEQRNQILDLLFKPKFGASISALLVEVPGDGNSTQGSEPSHMHTRSDENYFRGYEWWLMKEAKKRNPKITLDANAWSAPRWIGNNNFWSQDMCDYYAKWIKRLKEVHGLTLDAVGCRNEKGVSYDFVKKFRKTLNVNGLEQVKIHAFDNWPKDKFDFVKDLKIDSVLRASIDIISAHTLSEIPAPANVIEFSQEFKKPIWNSEEHVYKEGFDCAISIVQAFNRNFIESRATKIVNWYLVGSTYSIEPYAETPAMMIAREPWSGYYYTREALWGYAHYGQFTEAGWDYITNACGTLQKGGTYVTMKSPKNDYSIIIETKGASQPQKLSFEVRGGLSNNNLCIWKSNSASSFIRLEDIIPVSGRFEIVLDTASLYSISTTRGQQKGSFKNIPASKLFPFPYYETFEQYTDAKNWGYLPRYTADIVDAFEIVERPDKKGKCLRQVVPAPTISWAPDWLPYTILGDENWQDYEISADVFFNTGDSAGIMGRINHVGSGYGCIPKGYFLQLGVDGQCRLSIIRGKKEKRATGDAEHQAAFKPGQQDGGDGEKVLGEVKVPRIAQGQWHNLKLRFEGSAITGLVDNKPVLSVTDSLYHRGMAGLLAGGDKTKLCTPYFDNVLINSARTHIPKPSRPLPEQRSIYGKSK